MYRSFIFTALHLNNSSPYNVMFIREIHNHPFQKPLGANQAALSDKHNVAHCKVALPLALLRTSNDSSQVVPRKSLPKSIHKVLHMAPTSDVAVVFVSTCWLEERLTLTLTRRWFGVNGVSPSLSIVTGVSGLELTTDSASSKNVSS